MEIGQKLKDKRTALGLTQEALADQMGVSRQTIANWEKGKTYPDIASVLKLSDLYNVSLDELLKEDAAMRKHTEEAAALPRKYWNYLFEFAVLMLPFGLLVAYWGIPWIGLGMQILGVLMLPPLWLVRHRMFGMSGEDLRQSLIGWGLWVSAQVIHRLAGENLFLMLISTVMMLVGLLGVYRHGVCLEKSTRYWLVIFLYVGIPLFVLGSGFVQMLSDAGAFNKAQPFGHQYRIEAVEVGTTEDPNVIIKLDNFTQVLVLGEERMGMFEALDLTDHQKETSNGIWQLVPEEYPEALYKLEVSTANKTTLSYFIDDQLQWRWALKQIPKAWFGLRTKDAVSGSDMNWFSSGTFSGDLSLVNYTTLSGEGDAFLQCRFEGVTQLTLVEEYYHNGQRETREYTITQDKSENYPIADGLKKRYESGEQYILYRLQWDGGEYLFCLKFQ